MKKILLALLVLLIIPGVMAVSVSVNKPRYSTNEAVSVSVSQCGGVSLLNLNNAQGQLVFVDQGVGNWETNYHTSSDSSVGNYNVLVSCGVDEVQVSFCVGDAAQCPTAGASSASSDSSGGGSRGSGGILPGAAKGKLDCGGQSCTMTWGKIFAKERATIDLKNIALTQVAFTAKYDITGSPRLEVRQLSTLPRSLSAFLHAVYQRLEIVPRQLVGEALIDPTISFRVEKSWVSQQQLGKNQISLFRYLANRWDDLQAKFVKEDTTYYYYTASTPGFSYFLIGGTGAAEAALLPTRTPTPAVRPSQPAPVARPSAVPSYRPVPSAPVVPALEEELPEEEAALPLWIWVAVGAVVIIGGAAIFWVLRKRS